MKIVIALSSCFDERTHQAALIVRLDGACRRS